jgi:hypothetical protein
MWSDGGKLGGYRQGQAEVRTCVCGLAAAERPLGRLHTAIVSPVKASVPPGEGLMMTIARVILNHETDFLVIVGGLYPERQARPGPCRCRALGPPAVSARGLITPTFRTVSREMRAASGDAFRASCKPPPDELTAARPVPPGACFRLYEPGGGVLRG